MGLATSRGPHGWWYEIATCDMPCQWVHMVCHVQLKTTPSSEPASSTSRLVTSASAEAVAWSAIVRIMFFNDFTYFNNQEVEEKSSGAGACAHHFLSALVSRVGENADCRHQRRLRCA